MRISHVRVRGYRSLGDLDVDLDSLTVLIGANSTGKSSFLNALAFFFDDTHLTEADINWLTPAREVAVHVTFVALDERDRAEFGRYAAGEAMTLVRRWSREMARSKLTGRGRAFPGFRPWRDATDGNVRRSIYAALRSEFGLSAAARVEDQERQLLAWEEAHDDRCEDAEFDVTHLFGGAEEGKLSSRFRFVPIPAVRDAEVETREGRNTILTRLVAGIREQFADTEDRLSAFGERVQSEYDEILAASHRGALLELGSSLQARLRNYVPAATVVLEGESQPIELTGPRILLRVGENDELTDVGRQGHGFQRAFLMASLELLADSGVPSPLAPALLLAIEEPELYQHPTRARSMAAVLDRLANNRERQVQVCYATHSPYFIQPHRYERLRVFRRDPRGGRRAHAASATDVANRLDGVVPREQIERRLGRTMEISFNESFFARCVLLAEGRTDARGALQGVADRLRFDLDALGIIVLGGGGKGALPIRFAILEALGIPAVVVFDGDSHLAKNRESAAKQNLAIQAVLRVPGAQEFPPNSAGPNYVCFERNLEDYLTSDVQAFEARCTEVAKDCDWRAKSDETYRLVLADVEPPALLRHALERAVAMALPG